MFMKAAVLNPIHSIQLKPEEAIILKWLRSVAWTPVTDRREPVPYKARIPEFFGGVRLYPLQSSQSGGVGALELFIRRLSIQGIITKTELYPIEGRGSQTRYLYLKKADLDNLGVGQPDDEDE